MAKGYWIVQVDITDPEQFKEYATANAGVVGLTRAIASELYPYGITCNAFSPFAKTRASFELTAYAMATEKEGQILVDADEKMLEATPSPDDIGPFLVYLASDAAAEVSGGRVEGRRVSGVEGSCIDSLRCFALSTLDASSSFSRRRRLDYRSMDQPA